MKNCSQYCKYHKLVNLIIIKRNCKKSQEKYKMSDNCKKLYSKKIGNLQLRTICDTKKWNIRENNGKEIKKHKKLLNAFYKF